MPARHPSDLPSSCPDQSGDPHRRGLERLRRRSRELQRRAAELGAEMADARARAAVTASRSRALLARLAAPGEPPAPR